MKKKKNNILIITIIALIGIFATTTVYAGYAWYYLSIPTMQGWVYTNDNTGNGYVTGSSSNHANVYIEGFSGIAAVTFYAGAIAGDGSSTWGTTGGTIYRSDFENHIEDEVYAPFKYTYGTGQKVGLRARNHNWSLNNGTVTGTVDYH